MTDLRRPVRRRVALPRGPVSVTSACWLLIAAVFPILFWAALLIVSLVPYLPQR